MQRRMLGFIGSIALVATSLFGATAAAAAPSIAVDVPPCVADISPNPAMVGEPVVFTVSGFAPNEYVNIDRVRNGVPGDSNTVPTDSSGVWLAGAGFNASDAGAVYVFTFTGLTTGATCSGTLTLTAAATTTTVAVDPSTTAPAAEAAAVNAAPAFTG